MPAPDSVLSLVERFREHRDEYLSAGYNEATLRREFLEPMFKALGWDVDNTKGYAEAYKEVVHEDAIKISGATKAPDYAFRLGGARKFFVEAKKPSVDVKGDPSPAYQLRRYAWSAKLPLSVLTDFHEFAVYDCTKKPDLTDTAASCRILYLTCGDYAKRWEEIAELFSPEAIQKGAFDKHAASAKRKGTTTVDDAFLKEIEAWRDLLARNLALRNPGLTQRELNTAVQTTIDRIIFLRICEDRGIEEYGVLRGLVNGTCIYARMLGVFRAADERYNSGLFHFRSEKDRPGEPDTLTLGLVIDDKALKEILDALYYPKSPYEFSVLPADILGHVYEQFLGKVIRLTAGHRAVVEEKPEVKKAGGVYYTPTYIVDYIVKNTVGQLLEGMTPKEAGSLRILDPACGSGSFLLGAYQLLLDWHQAWYAGHDPERWARGRRPTVFLGQDGEWRLTTAERKRILLDCIYGVDIDPQAVEVTKLSLLLKVLEGEDAESIGKTLSLLRERALPDLGKNIQCGNSLIGPDFYDDHLIDTLTEEERYEINAFDWEEAFPEIMRPGGFDAVIGNPPYLFARELLTLPARRYFAAHYPTSTDKANTYMLFMARMKDLLNEAGLGGYIVPNSWLTIETASSIRRLLLPYLRSVVDLSYPVFEGVSMEPCVFVVSGDAAPSRDVGVMRVDSPAGLARGTMTTQDPALWSAPQFRITIARDPKRAMLMKNLANGAGTVADVFEVRTGLQAYERGKGIPPQSAADVRDHVFDRPEQDQPTTLRYLSGSDVRRYATQWSGLWLQYGKWLAQPRSRDIFTRPRVLVREITSRLPRCFEAMFTCDTYLNNKSVLNVLHPQDDDTDLKCLLAALNSRLLSAFYVEMAVKSARKIFPKVVTRNLAEFPYPKAVSRASATELASLVDRMLDLHQREPSPRTDHERAIVQRQIEATDRKIDELVYELYGLTDEEIHIVEEAAK